MGIFNEILSGRFNRSLQKIFAIKGSAPVRQLGGEVLPVHKIRSDVENRYLESWNRFSISPAGIVGAAGNSAEFRLRNPGRFNSPVGTPDSNVIAVLEKLTVSITPAGELDLSYEHQFPGSDLSVVPAWNTMDFRNQSGNVAGPSVLVPSTSTLTNLRSFVAARVNLGAQQTFDFINNDDQAWVLGPSDLLQLQTVTAATTLQVWCIWRERLLEESERF